MKNLERRVAAAAAAAASTVRRVIRRFTMPLECTSARKREGEGGRRKKRYLGHSQVRPRDES